MSVKPIPEGFHTLTPHIVIKGAAEALEFYTKAFNAEVSLCMPGPGGTVMHAEMKIGDSHVMIADEFPGHSVSSPKTVGGTTFSLALYTEDCDAAYAQAVEAGATAEMPPTDMFWGDRYSKVMDPWGHSWEISTHKEDLSPEEIGERAAQFFASMGDGGCPPES
ncbi:MAG: glyoxalase [Planctomycetes bacterium]|nr:glyoxalase [Planctomycetota bacterium]